VAARPAVWQVQVRPALRLVDVGPDRVPAHTLLVCPRAAVSGGLR